MNAVVKMNVMSMPSAITHLVATPVTVRLDTAEMEGTVQVCEQTHTILCMLHIFVCVQISMSVRIQVAVYCVMRMPTAMTLMAVNLLYLRM